MSDEIESTTDQVIKHIDNMLLRHGKEKGLKIIEAKLMKLSLACDKVGDTKNAEHFLEILAELKVTLGAQSN